MLRVNQSLPGVTPYIRITEGSKRRYERIGRRNPQMCGPQDVYAIRSYEQGKRKWLSVGTTYHANNNKQPQIATRKRTGG